MSHELFISGSNRFLLCVCRPHGVVVDVDGSHSSGFLLPAAHFCWPDACFWAAGMSRGTRVTLAVHFSSAGRKKRKKRPADAKASPPTANNGSDDWLGGGRPFHDSGAMRCSRNGPEIDTHPMLSAAKSSRKYLLFCCHVPRPVGRAQFGGHRPASDANNNTKKTTLISDDWPPTSP